MECLVAVAIEDKHEDKTVETLQPDSRGSVVILYLALMGLSVTIAFMSRVYELLPPSCMASILHGV